jgi:hypothetical protein
MKTSTTETQRHGEHLQAKYLKRSICRMARLVELKAPDVIIANEARILLRSYHGGCWRAIGHWTWREIQREASDALWAAQVWWYRALHDATYEQAADVLLDRIEQKESRVKQ